MKTPTFPALIIALAGTIFFANAQTNEMPSVVEPGATVQKLAGGFAFTEGPSCDANGNVFFTDQPNNRIMEWSVDSKLSTFKQPAGRANGMYFDAKGNLIACADEKTALWSITPEGGVTVLVDQYDGKRLNGPNDVWVRPDHGMYLTDPFYARPWWDYKERPQDVEAVYYLSPDRKTFKRVITDFQKPNGIIGTPDGKSLFVADIQGRKTFGYDIQPDGSLTNKRQVATSGSDGMTIDSEGNLYLTAGHGVHVFDSKTAQSLGVIPFPEMPANVCFGGKDKKTLFVCARTGFYSIRMKFRGANQSK
ncbi:MAG TPA: SMP-30/gluconolactonase/LRE family protein [Candidatus Angelobacter sp.]|nr:SMP-30/gluconolactonase/LRE family protein [Candidatus Angelobacter sp.]